MPDYLSDVELAEIDSGERKCPGVCDYCFWQERCTTKKREFQWNIIVTKIVG